MSEAIVPGLYGIFGPVNVYVLDDGDEGVTIIDAGLPWAWQGVLDLVRDIGRTPQDVRHIVITHADLDHVGGLGRLVRATGATVYASALSQRYIQKRQPPPHVPAPMKFVASAVAFIMQRAARVDHVFADGDVLDIAGSLRVMATPGHTEDHFSVYWEREGVLFTGDLLNNNDGVSLTPKNITWSTDAACASARNVLELDAQVMCFGHGPVWRAAEDPDGLAALRARL